MRIVKLAVCYFLFPLVKRVRSHFLTCAQSARHSCPRDVFQFRGLDHFLRPARARLLSPGYKGKCMNDKTWQVQIKNFEPDRDILLQVPQD
jgi:hypothetical protein